MARKPEARPFQVAGKRPNRALIRAGSGQVSEVRNADALFSCVVNKSASDEARSAPYPGFCTTKSCFESSAGAPFGMAFLAAPPASTAPNGESRIAVAQDLIKRQEQRLYPGAALCLLRIEPQLHYRHVVSCPWRINNCAEKELSAENEDLDVRWLLLWLIAKLA